MIGNSFALPFAAFIMPMISSTRNTILTRLRIVEINPRRQEMA
jgi:hypothetical protein